ncbi:MAPEG family protein [Yoonia maritima]|uniref:MAPEG family protein n=1 Tax=Yoonia maritima TaxID=1435347 RepID=A0A2T0W2J0_9RHOB|nr:MAPEG family protein [Yoonia maritima]PRY79366.1 MAPEG family protein [Yoonia maritima]
MTPELTVLALAGVLQGIQFCLMSIPANIELGTGKTSSPRDPQRLSKPLMDQASVGTGRLFRAMNNHFEALIMFTIAVVVITLGDKGTGFSAACAWAYLGARVLYIPAYYFGWAPWRSLIWFVGFLSTMLMIISTLF